MGTTNRFLVCGDAYYPVEGKAPTGFYGSDWAVVDAPTGRAAVDALYAFERELCLPVDTSLLALGDAVALFEKDDPNPSLNDAGEQS